MFNNWHIPLSQELPILRIVFLIVLASALSCGAASAQTSSLDIDELYTLARQAAFEEKNYEKARMLAYRALERSPDYYGIRIFVARLYRWEGKYEKAQKELHQILEQDAGNRQALMEIIQVESLAGRYDQALSWFVPIEKYHPDDPEFQLRRAAILENMEQFDQAERIYRDLLRRDPGNREARNALQSVELRQMKYEVSLSYRHDRFGDIFDPWNFWELQLSRQTAIGSFIGRVQYAKRFGNEGLQFNLDAYPPLFSGLYAYVSGGYSGDGIYPKYRFGLSLYKSLPAGFELEGGFRYLKFSASRTAIYTGSLSKYLGSYLFTARTFLVPSSAGSSHSIALLARRYFGDANSYLGISGGYGSASADIRFMEDVSRLNSWSLAIEGRHPLNDRIHLGMTAGYDSEEFEHYNRDRISVKVFLSYRF